MVHLRLDGMHAKNRAAHERKGNESRQSPKQWSMRCPSHERKVHLFPLRNASAKVAPFERKKRELRQSESQGQKLANIWRNEDLSGPGLH
jgi:hypothetical protein